MSLTPTSHDPNKKSELERKKKDPFSFGDFGDLKKKDGSAPGAQGQGSKTEAKTGG